MGLKSGEIDNLLIRQLKQTANKPVTRLVLLTGFNTPPAPSQEGKGYSRRYKCSSIFIYNLYYLVNNTVGTLMLGQLLYITAQQSQLPIVVYHFKRPGYQLLFSIFI